MNEFAGQLAPPELLVNLEELNHQYYEHAVDTFRFAQRVRFGTSGHRGTPLDGSFTEKHVQAIVQAVIDYRRMVGEPPILYIGKDTHAISDAAQKTALGVLAANGITTQYQKDNDVTPTPVISHRILKSNQEAGEIIADGIIITPSHNPPTDGGIKYNPPHGGPADTNITDWIENRANEYLEDNNRNVRYVDYEQALKSKHLTAIDFAPDYINDLENIIDFDIIRKSGIKLGVDPLGGASVRYWGPIAKRYNLDLTIVNDKVDPTFSFVPRDHDGKIRMDCSSPWSMSKLVELKDRFDLAFANDPDSDRHGIVSREVGLMNPNHFLSVAIDYLLRNRPLWSLDKGIGKTLVSSGMIDRVVLSLGRVLYEVPVGFKWFVHGLFDGTIAFGGEESAGASFLKFDGSVWTTDKDGLIMCLLAAEIRARTGQDPGAIYRDFEKRFGAPVYRRMDHPTTPEQKAAFKNLTPERVSASLLAGEPILQKLTNAPGNDAPIGGLKVVTKNGWFAARPSGTENIYKIYAESFLSEEHLSSIMAEASQIVTDALAAN